MLPAEGVSLADLAAAGIHLTAVEAVTVVAVLLRHVQTGELPGLPSAESLRFTPAGSIGVAGPVGCGEVSAARVAALLEYLLSGVDGSQSPHVGGPLRLAIARALGTVELPPYASVQAFAEALERFSAPDTEIAVRRLWARALGIQALTTVSDVRRARRATGITLREISRRTAVPVSLLQELEWGYFANWPSGMFAYEQIVRYARAAGLDPGVVLEVVWPAIDEARRAEETVSVDLVRISVPIGSSSETALASRRTGAVTSRRRARSLMASLAVAAVVLVSLTQPTPKDRIPPVHPVSGPARVASGPVASVVPARFTEATASLPLASAGIGSAVFDGARSAGRKRSAADAGGTLLRIVRLVDDHTNAHVRLSPDRARLAFDSDRDGHRAVYVADTAGRRIRRVTGAGFSAMPHWSPDGRRLSLVRAEPDQPHVWNLWVVDLTSGRTRRLTSYTRGQISGGSWFPDGRRIVYSRGDRLIVLDLAGGPERVLPSPRRGTRLDAPAVSPDGRRIVFEVQGDGPWMLDLRNRSMRRMLADPSAQAFTWAADSRRLAFHSEVAGGWAVWRIP